MAKTQELFLNLKKALAKLREAHSFPAGEPFMESTIQRFEYTFELSWKVMSSILADEQVATVGVRNVIRAATSLGLIDNPEQWFSYAEARSLSSHIYREAIARRMYAVARGDFVTAVDALIAKAERYA